MKSFTKGIAKGVHNTAVKLYELHALPLQLASEVFQAALDNQIAIEPVSETSPKWVTSPVSRHRS